MISVRISGTDGCESLLSDGDISYHRKKENAFCDSNRNGGCYEEKKDKMYDWGLDGRFTAWRMRRQRQR